MKILCARKSSFFAIFLALFFCGINRVQAQNSLLILVVPGLKAEDLNSLELPALQNLAQQSSIGWMNCRTARVAGQSKEPEAAGYLTIGAGARARSREAYSETIHQMMLQARQDNEGLDHDVTIGLLGKLCANANLPIHILGNLDSMVKMPFGPLIFGENITSQDNSFVRLRTSPSGIADKCPESELIGQSGMTLIGFGDLKRADEIAPKCFPEIAAMHRRNARKHLDEFLQILTLNARGRNLIILSPVAAISADPVDRLSPVLIHGKGFGAGWLMSPSTHIKGLITNTDMLPTILSMVSIRKPNGIDGSVVISMPSDEANAKNWRTIHGAWVERSRMQSFAGGFPIVQSVFAIILAIVSFHRIIRHICGEVFELQFAIATLVGLPFALLVIPCFHLKNQFVSEISIVISISILGSVIGRKKETTILTRLIGLFIAVTITDMFTGCMLLSNGWMSYSIMEGARYYGIGNEYAGSLFGAVMCFIGISSRPKKGQFDWRLLLIFVLLVATGAPMFGAKAGSVLGMAIGGGVAALYWRRGSLRYRDAFFVIAAAAGILALMLAIDLVSGGATHFARAILNGGSLWNIALRKFELNLYLLRHSVWSLPLLTSIVALYFAAKHWRTEHTIAGIEKGAFYGIISGSIGLFLFNDSGTISAALTLLMTAGVAYHVSRAGEYTARQKSPSVN